MYPIRGVVSVCRFNTRHTFINNVYFVSVPGPETGTTLNVTYFVWFADSYVSGQSVCGRVQLQVHNYVLSTFLTSDYCGSEAEQKRVTFGHDVGKRCHVYQLFSVSFSSIVIEAGHLRVNA